MTVFSVILTGPHVAVVIRVCIVVIGTSLMETDCNLVIIFTRVTNIKELTSVVGVQPHQLACIIVTLQKVESNQLTRKRVYVGLYAYGRGL